MLRGIARGSAVCVGLPIFEAMLNTHGDALADGSDLPTRFVSFFWGDGVILDRWEPEQVGERWELSPTLMPLESVKDYVSVVSGMQNRAERRVTHHEGMGGFSGYDFITGDSDDYVTNAGGPTLDQVIADHLEGCTPIHSVHMRVSKEESSMGDGGTTYIAMSHRQNGDGLVARVPETNPQEVWATLFGEFVPKPDDAALRRSILDHVRDDADRLRGNLGQVDRQRLDAHLEGIYELEQVILAEPPSCDIPRMPSASNTNVGGIEPVDETVDAMSRLLAYAFACDITRVASFQMKRMAADTIYNEGDGTEGIIHHNASHTPGTTMEEYAAGITYQMEKFADLLNVFGETVDVNGDSLLDTSIIYATSDCSTGWTHSVTRQPILVAGRGRGYLRHPGIHHTATPFNGDNDSPNGAGNMSDVLLTCLQAFDPTASSVGGGAMRSETPLAELVASEA